MSIEAFGVFAVIAWVGAMGAAASAMARREVADYFELLKSKAAHPAGKRQNK